MYSNSSGTDAGQTSTVSCTVQECRIEDGEISTMGNTGRHINRCGGATSGDISHYSVGKVKRFPLYLPQGRGIEGGSSSDSNHTQQQDKGFTQQGVKPNWPVLLPGQPGVGGGLRNVFADATGCPAGKLYSVMV